jgi:site-specific recombinase XerD
MKVNEKLSILLMLENSKASKDGTVPITIRLTVNSKRAELSLGQKVHPDRWNQAGNCAKGNSQEAWLINAAIDKAKTKLRQEYDLLASKHNYVSALMVKMAYKGETPALSMAAEATPGKTLLEVTDFVLERNKKKVLKNHMAPGTLTKWKTTKTKLVSFLEENMGKSDLPLNELNYAFAEDFVDFLMLEKDIQSNSAMKYLKNAKHIITVAVNRDWIDKNPIASFPCSYVHPERDILDSSEISTMYNKELHTARLKEVRDCYLFMCFTGYAYKDASILTPQHVTTFIDGNEWIVKNREKTWCRENVPLLPVAKEIIERYKNHPYCLKHNLLLPINSNQKYNEYLKELAEICGINKHLTTHTARHTFATTVTLANGVPLETVSALLGHKSIKTTQIYAKIVASKIWQDMNKLKNKLKRGLVFTIPPDLLRKPQVA